MELNEPAGIQVQADPDTKSLWEKFSKNQKILAALTVFGFVVILLVIFAKPSRENAETVKNKPIITPAIVVITSTPALPVTRWSSDSAVLKVENENKNLKNDIENVDLVESALSLPNIEVNVNFQK